MTYAALRGADPYTLDELSRRASWAARRSAASGAVLGRAFGLSATRGKRARLGDLSYAGAKNLATIHALATGEGTTAIPQLMEEWALMARLQVEALDNDELRALIEDLDARSFHAHARANARAREAGEGATPEDDEESATADFETAELHAYRAEARRERANRKRRGKW